MFPANVIQGIANHGSGITTRLREARRTSEVNSGPRNADLWQASIGIDAILDAEAGGILGGVRTKRDMDPIESYSHFVNQAGRESLI